MQVTETRLGLTYQRPNARQIVKLKLFPLSCLLELATPEELPVVGLPHTVNKNGLAVTAGTPLTEFRFPNGGCIMEESSTQQGEGVTWELKLLVNVPRNESGLIDFLERNHARQWVAIWQDANGLSYIGGEPENGLKMQVSRGIGPQNQTTISLRSRNYHSVYFLESYLSSELFPDADFDLAFDFSFNA